MGPPPATHGLDAPTPASLSASHLRSMTGLDDHMSNFSYVEGHFLSQADIALHVALGGAPEQVRHPHAARWYKHISFLRAHYAFGVRGSNQHEFVFAHTVGFQVYSVQEIFKVS